MQNKEIYPNKHAIYLMCRNLKKKDHAKYDVMGRALTTI